MPDLLHAKVVASKNTTKHFLGFGADAVELPVPSRVIITESTSGVFLLRELDGQIITDTWHESVEDAKRQAVFEYELGLWSTCD